MWTVGENVSAKDQHGSTQGTVWKYVDGRKTGVVMSAGHRCTSAEMEMG